jgi:hypothetical protein
VWWSFQQFCGTFQRSLAITDVFRDFPRTLRFFSKLGDRLWRVSSGFVGDFVVFSGLGDHLRRVYGGVFRRHPAEDEGKK